MKIHKYTFFKSTLRNNLKWTNIKVHCICCVSVQMIMYNSLFPSLSIAYVMLIKMYYNGSLLNSLTPHNIQALERGRTGDDFPKYVIVWDNVSFQHFNIIWQWFATHNRMLMEFLSSYFPFLNPIEEYFISMEMESIWSPATYTVNPSGCHGCSEWWHHSRCLQRLDKTL